MATTLGAVLVAEIGSLITRVTLIDQVDGESRMVGHAETSSSVEAPYQNALYGILEATAQISELTGRQLIREGQLIMPQSSERDGVNQLVAVTSAAGTMALVITAIASDVSAHSATHASRATYTALLQTVTLDDAAEQTARGPGDKSWIERQVESLLTLRPDAVLIAGGLEHGAVDAVNRLAHIVGLTAVSTGIDASGQQRQEMTARPVIYAGNSGAREQVIGALSDRAELFVVDNLRPALDRANLDPARQELARLYEKQILPRLPGLAALRRMSRAPVRTVCDAEGLVTRFLAERTGRRVLTVDVGASATTAMYAAPGVYRPAVLGTTGVAYGLTDLLAAPGVAAIARWLPFAIGEGALTERLLNRALRPQALPADREDLFIEHALAREALRAAYAALQDEAPSHDYDWVLATGGVLAHAPQPGLALLTILDALQPTGADDRPVLDVYLDSVGLLPVGGALAPIDPDAAVTVVDRDLLRNMPLASVVVPLGDGRAGDVAVEVELSVVGGGTERRAVRHGEIVRLSLSPGRFGRLTLRPAGGMRIGSAAPGEAVSSEGGDVAGSALGLVIDARGRPLALPDDDGRRRAALWDWLVALGAERGQSPYLERAAEPIAPAAAAPQPAVPALTPVAEPPETPAAAPAPEPAAATPDVAQSYPSPPAEVAPEPASSQGKRVSLDDMREAAPQTTPLEPPPPAGIDSDLDALRQSVEEPKRRGLFGRKK
jgi:hypothetical protein